MSTLTADEITAEDVLGALIWRLQNQGHIPPRILCMSEEARQRNRDLARETIEGGPRVMVESLTQDERPKAVQDETRCRLTWIIAESGECVVGFAGGSFMAFTNAAGAAWTLRKWADGIERDGEKKVTP